MRVSSPNEIYREFGLDREDHLVDCMIRELQGEVNKNPVAKLERALGKMKREF